MAKLMVRGPLSAFLLIGLLAGTATLIAGAGIPADDGVIYGCYQVSTGQLRVVPSPDDCKRPETTISWNQVGPAGPEGPAGAEGPAGPTGPQGPAGVADVYSADRALGEFPIALFTDWQTIARFDLPAGRYAITAMTRLRNDSSYGTDVFCGVLVGSRPFDAADTVWGGASTSQAITGVSTLAGPGSITLRCRADASGAITLVSFSLTAMTVGGGGTTSTTGSTGSTAGGTTTAGATSTTGGAGSTSTTTSTTGGATSTTGGATSSTGTTTSGTGTSTTGGTTTGGTTGGG